MLSLVTAFLAIPPQQFKLVLDSVIWAFKHTMRNVSDTGLSILYQMLQNIATNDAAAQSFYQTYYTDVLQHIFSVVTDSSHTAGMMSVLAVWLVGIFVYVAGNRCHCWNRGCLGLVTYLKHSHCFHLHPHPSVLITSKSQPPTMVNMLYLN